MQRRHFINSSAIGLLAAHAPGWAQGVDQRAGSAGERILILVELKGGNDGLNTVVPYADPAYAQLRTSLALPKDSLHRIDESFGLHPELKALVPLWERDELAVVQGLGYPQPNLSHFRSIEIWQTSSKPNEYLDDGWIGRAMRAGLGERAKFTTEGVLIGGGDFGPLAGARAVSLSNPEAFLNQSRYAKPVAAQGNEALKHLLQVEADVHQAAAGLRSDKFNFTTEFPTGGFGNSAKAAAQIVASQRGKPGVPVITLSLGSFDTHVGQLGAQANLMKQLGEGLAALRSALVELGAWDRTLVMTYSEFGRRPKQNQSNGTDHGTAAPHFVMGGAVRGGQFYGKAPDLTKLDAAQNLHHTTDFRQLYATIAKDWWGVKPETVVRGNFETLKLLRT